MKRPEACPNGHETAVKFRFPLLDPCNYRVVHYSMRRPAKTNAADGSERE